MNDKLVHVAVGVVENSKGEILIAKRPDHLHQGGLWEFPGGKVEAGESVQAALQRELAEEVDLKVSKTQPLIRIPYHYADKSVLLDVHRVSQFTGDARGMEGQLINWVAKPELAEFDFPAANRPILKAISLPDVYLITGEFVDLDDFNQRLTQALSQGIRLVQLRVSEQSGASFAELVKNAKDACYKAGARLIINSSVEQAQALEVEGIHLNSKRLMSYTRRPVSSSICLSASVHNETELAHANQLEVDFAVIAPVLPTNSHPGAATLGWEQFQQLAEQAMMPVYALGGMMPAMLSDAVNKGAQGIAGISHWWSQDGG